MYSSYRHPREGSKGGACFLSENLPCFVSFTPESKGVFEGYSSPGAQPSDLFKSLNECWSGQICLAMMCRKDAKGVTPRGAALGAVPGPGRARGVPAAPGAVRIKAPESSKIPQYVLTALT